jgi:hypothetical protein
MESIKSLNSFEQVNDLVSQIRERRISKVDVMEHFRGQGRSEYKLTPTIARNVLIVSELMQREEHIFSELKQNLKNTEYAKLLRSDEFLNDQQNDWNLLFQLQHLGVQTRMLDWSLKWEVGLWFAVENEENDDVDGQFWVFSVPNEIHLTDTRDNFYNKEIKNIDSTFLINAPIYWSGELSEQVGEIKRQRQFGKFSISSFERAVIPLEEQPEINQYLEKYCIPSSVKKEIRNRLESLGIHEEWLYYRESTNNEFAVKIKELLNNTIP